MQKVSKIAKFILTNNSEGAKGSAKLNKTLINLYQKSSIGNNSTNLHLLTHPKTRLASCNAAKAITTNKTLKICLNKNRPFTFKKSHLPSMRKYPSLKAQGTIYKAK